MNVTKRTVLAMIPILSALFSGCTSLVNRMAFYPDSRTMLPASQLPPQVQEVWLTTADRQRLQCYFVRNTESQKLLIYFHGNAGNIAQRVPELLQFSRMGTSVLGVGYRGYGQSTGKPSEKGIYADGAAGLAYGLKTLEYAGTNIFICGRSIGTTVAINTAKNQSLAGIILITPLTTGKEFARAHGFGSLTFLSGNAFDNLSKCPNLRSPILVLHGTADEVMPYVMSHKVLERLPEPKQLVTIEGGHHNTLELEDPTAYWGAIQQFIQSHGN